MGILDSQGPKSRCDPGTSNWALIWFKSWEGGDISHKLVTIFPSSRYPPKIQRGGELITRKNTLVICYIFELTFIEAWKMFLEKSTKHPFSPLLTSMTLMESKYWNSEQKCTAQMKEEKQVLIFIDLCTRLDWTGAFRQSVNTWSKSELHPGRWQEHLVMKHFHTKHAGTKALSITSCYISLYHIKNTFIKK